MKDTALRSIIKPVGTNEMPEPSQTRIPEIAVLIPCYNEAATIDGVIRGFRKSLPSARIFVYDNNSTDQTIAVARAAGASVRSEKMQGKGNVVRRMFSDIEADIYVLVDGDGTYDPSAAPRMISLLRDDELDMVNGRRVAEEKHAYPVGHKFGNRVLSGAVALVFGARFKDMLSGYRVLTRRFVKSFPALTKEFEIETELTVHALELALPVAEVDTQYRERPPGSESKLRTLRDGWKIALAITILVKEERPLQVFSTLGLGFLIGALILAAPLLPTYITSGEVPRFPTAILATGLAVTGIVSFFSGLILDTVTHGRREMKRLHYLSAQRR
jgi:glycosyltransferase involved in cell wall biosynthesis